MQSLALGEAGAGLGGPLDLLPVGPVEGERGERGVELDLGGEVADLLGDLSASR